MAKSKKLIFKIRKLGPEDKKWVKNFIIKHWGAEKVISRRKVYYPEKLAGFLAVKNKKHLGLITYNINGNSCEIITINSTIRRKGIGTALIKAVQKVAKASHCRRLWFITTNDNLYGLWFWQKRGFLLKAVHPNAIAFSRKLKPQIPKIGNFGIPIRDEIELEKIIK